MERNQRRTTQTLGIACAAVPFVFALIRAVTSGSDTRYFWVALAATAGASLVLAQRGSTTAAAIVTRSVASFVLSTAAAVLVARGLGTRLGPGLLVVATAFGFCNAAGVALYGWRDGPRA